MKNIILLILASLLYYSPLKAQSDPDVECTEAVEKCKSEIIAFAKDFLGDVPKDCKYWKGDCGIAGEIWRNGSVSLGTSKNYSTWKNEYFKLTVLGGITTEQLQICKAAWCDYVFEDSFNLKSLPEVAMFIDKNKHLPDCTPGGTIEKQAGFYLDEQTPQQQQKIEEAYLHLIALNDRVAVLKQKLNPQVNPINNSAVLNVVKHEATAKHPEAVVELECSEISPASSNTALDGLAGIRITGAQGPFQISWPEYGGGGISNVDCEDYLIRIPNLAAGTYTLTVKNADGVVGTCTLTITVSPPPSLCDYLGNRSRCRGELMALLMAEFDKNRPECTQWGGEACSNTTPIFRVGNVNIGTSVGKSGYNLAVAGGIMTDKFRVELCEGTWCDYVFEPEYHLTPLSDIKQFIKTHKSLPGMITQGEVTKEGGYELKTVKKEQQVKIEEAYLHLIEMDRTIQQLNQSLQDF